MFKSSYFGARYYGQRFFGKRGLVVDGAYNGSRYFGLRYFGVRYFGTSYQNSPAPLTATNTPALSGVLGLAGGLTFGGDFSVTQTGSLALSSTLVTSGSLSFDNEDWAFTPPLSVSGLAGALTVAGSITIASPAPGFGGYFGRRYFGGRFYGPRYFGSLASWPLTLTAGVGLAGGLNAAGSISTTLAMVQTNTIGLTGTLTGSLSGIQHNGPEVIGRGLIDWRAAQVQQDTYSAESQRRIVAVMTILAATGVLD